MEKRVFFQEGKQKKFVQDLKINSSLSWIELAKRLNINEGTLSKSYQFELCSIPYDIFKKTQKFLKESEKMTLKKYNAKVENEKIIIGRKVFGEKRKILYPIEIKFSNKNLNLDISKVNYSKDDLKKGIKLPKKITAELAEEIGMQFGDGFLSSRRYDYRLKGNPYDEKDYYLNYIKPLFKKVYNLEVNPKEFDRSFGFEIYSRAIWEFKAEVLGIKQSPKYEITFPDAFKVKNEEILAAFLRGLFDTDGCVNFKTKYGYKNYYPAIEIMLTSKKLIREIAEIIKMFGFNPSVSYNERYGRIGIYGIEAFKRFEVKIGWSSQKNLNRIIGWKKRYPELYYGDCSLMAEHPVVVRETRVRFPSFALQKLY